MMTGPGEPTRDSHDAATTPIGATPPDTGDAAQLLERLQRGIGDAFQLLELIGKGGMGVVFRAREKALDREVALKVLAFDPQLVPDAFARFEREARLAARLDHPHIVPIFAVGQGQGIAFYTMRLVRGGSLEEVLAAERRIEAPRAIRYLREVASALDHAHANGVVHRDVKPANVMVGDGDHVFVADFGIARAVGGDGPGLTSTGVIGSPAYMAPEQWQGQGVDGRADQYAFGILAYELLTGKRPYRDATMQQLLRLHLTEDLPDISQELPTVSPAVRAALARATAKDPKDRFASTTEFVTELDRALSAHATPEHGATTVVGAPVGASQRTRGRARWLVPAAGLTAIAAAAIALVQSRNAGSLQTPPPVASPETVTVNAAAVPETVRVETPAPPETVRVGQAVPGPGAAAGAVSYIAVFHPMTGQPRYAIDGVPVAPRSPPVFPVTPGRHVVMFQAHFPTIPPAEVVRVAPGDTVRALFAPAQGGGARGEQMRQQVMDRARRAQQGLGAQRGGAQRGRGGQVPPVMKRGDTTLRRPPPPPQ